MDTRLQFTELPNAPKLSMIAGWRQWADAGSVSSALPEFIIEQLGARKIGEFGPDGFYLFQIPGAHHLMRPMIELEDGLPLSLKEQRNEFYYAGDEEQGVVIFLGDEPHLNISTYADIFLTAVEQLGIALVAGVAGVFGPVPYQKERQVSCIYSLPSMKERLQEYALDFSNYAGGSSIDSYLVTKAGDRGIPYLTFYAFAPAYDFPSDDDLTQGIRLENDYRSWYDIMRRLNHLLGLRVNLQSLQQRSNEQAASVDKRLAELEAEMPELGIREFMDTIAADFTEAPFVLLDDFWEDELRGLFDDEAGVD